MTWGAVDMDGERVLTGGVEVRRVEHPALDLLLIGGEEAQILNRADQALGDQGLVDAGEPALSAVGGAQEEVAGVLGRAGDKGDGAITGKIEGTDDAAPCDEGGAVLEGRRAGEADRVDMGIALPAG